MRTTALAAKDNYDRALAGESHTNVRVYGDVEHAWYESFFNPVLDESGAIIGATGLARDITERKRAEERLAQMTRLYATLSQVNQAIVRVKEPEELYPAICDVAVSFGKLALAWVGLLDEGSGDIRPVAASGFDLAHWPFGVINLRHGPFKDGLAATAIRANTVIVSEQAQSDERMHGAHAQLQEHGFRSVAAVPFGLRGRTVGVLVLMSGESGFFDAATEVKLLEELELDISFALDSMATAADRRRAEEVILLQNRRLRILREIDKSILAAECVEDVVGAALSNVRDLVGCQRANLTLIDGEADESSRLRGEHCERD